MTENQPSTDTLVAAIAHLVDPSTGRKCVEQGGIREMRITDGKVAFYLALGQTSTPEAAALKTAAERALMAVPGVAEVHCKLVNAPPPAPSEEQKRMIPGARRVVAVSSGKGGVGKSTVCVNLAAAIARTGARVGILDGDIYGPNVPAMLGAKGKPMADGDRIVPLNASGMQVMSMALLVPDDQPMIWRGPRLNQAVQQFMFQVAWDNLDWLFVDLPPGTGDVQLTLTQNTDLTGAILVTTPADVAVLDVKKAVRMFEKIGTPILGVVENMSWFQPPGQAERYELFGSGGGAGIEREFNVPLLGQVPMGVPGKKKGPVVLTDPESETARAFGSIAEALAARTPATAQ